MPDKTYKVEVELTRAQIGAVASVLCQGGLELLRQEYTEAGSVKMGSYNKMSFALAEALGHSKEYLKKEAAKIEKSIRATLAAGNN